MVENMDTVALKTILQAAAKATRCDASATYPSRDAPPKTLLQFLVRMGSFTSTPKLANRDSQDGDIEWPAELTSAQLLERCRVELVSLPEMLPRVLCQLRTRGPQTFRLLQWNVLSQALGVSNDNFVACPREALQWPTRRYRLLQELLHHGPDILCLQEVDHFAFLSEGLGAAGYRGTFLPKPDSPCIYLSGNNGPDGCALFYRRDRFRLVQVETRVLEVWRVASNQVALLAVLEQRSSGRRLCVVTTHLKARQGAFLATLRNEQGRDLLRFVAGSQGAGLPLVLCGDFNAEPTEAVYQTITGNGRLASAYTLLPAAGEDAGAGNVAGAGAGSEPPFTTWKIRAEGEMAHTIDYVFYTAQTLEVHALLQLPTEADIGPGRLPSLSYPSDHLSLVTDFSFR